MPSGRPAIVEHGPASLADTELLARMFRALGDVTRLRILQLLSDGQELHQMEMVRRLGATQARVSEHLGCLVWCGFIDKRVEGRRTFYRIANSEVAALLSLAHRLLDNNEAQIACCRRIDEPAGEGCS